MLICYVDKAENTGAYGLNEPTSPAAAPLTERNLIMTSSTMRRIGGAVVAAVLLVSAVGCSGSSNKGGETTCAEYKAASTAEKKAIAEKTLEDLGFETSALKVTAARAAVRIFCATAGNDDDTINSIPDVASDLFD